MEEEWVAVRACRALARARGRGEEGREETYMSKIERR